MAKMTDTEKLNLLIRDDPEISGKMYARMKMHINEATVVDKQKWIPVAERLPENTDKVLALSKSKFGNGYLSWLVRYNPDVDAFYDYDSEWGNIKIHNITHWMPLPEPPKEDE